MRDPLHESLHESLHEPLRVLFVCTLPAVGGAASHLVSLATGLAAAGHRVAVVAESGSSLWSELERDGRVTLYEGAFTSTFARPAMDALRRAIRDLEPHCVLAVFERDYWGALRASAGYDVPCALLVHHAGLKRINRLLLPLLPRQFLVPSEDLRRWLISLGVSRARTRVLGNPVDTNHFAPNASRSDAFGAS